MKFHPSQKIISGMVILCFLISEVAGAAGPVPEKKFTPEINLPSEWGSVGQTHFPSPDPNTPFVFHIQTAHAHYESAKLVSEIIRYLQDHYQAELILAEGAAGPLHPEFLQFFKNRSLNHKVIDQLAQKGELTGVDLVLGKRDAAISAVGIEDPDFYRLAYQNFKKVFQKVDENETYLAEEKLKLDKQASQIFSSELRELMSAWQKFNSGNRNPLAVIRQVKEKSKSILGIDLEDPFSQFEWPGLVRIVLLDEMERKKNPQKLAEEKAKLSAWLGEHKISGQFLAAKPQSGKSARASYEEFLHQAYPVGFRFKDYPQVTYQMAGRVLESELERLQIFEELERIFQKLIDESAKTSVDRKLIQAYREFYLLEKLLNLELSRKEWNKVLASRRLCEAALPLRPKQSQNWIALDTSCPRNDGIRSALRFYHLAERREQIFLESVEREMKARKSKKAILVTGGFHAEGMASLFKEKGIGFASITPRIQGDFDSSLYHQVMLRKAHLEKLEFAIPARKQWGMTRSRNFTLSEYKTVRDILRGAGQANDSPYLKDRLRFFRRAPLPKPSLAPPFQKQARAEVRVEKEEELKNPLVLTKHSTRLVVQDSRPRLLRIGDLDLALTQLKDSSGKPQVLMSVSKGDFRLFQGTIPKSKDMEFISLSHKEILIKGTKGPIEITLGRHPYRWWEKIFAHLGVSKKNTILFNVYARNDKILSEILPVNQIRIILSLDNLVLENMAPQWGPIIVAEGYRSLPSVEDRTVAWNLLERNMIENAAGYESQGANSVLFSGRDNTVVENMIIHEETGHILSITNYPEDYLKQYGGLVARVELSDEEEPWYLFQRSSQALHGRPIDLSASFTTASGEVMSERLQRVFQETERVFNEMERQRRRTARAEVRSNNEIEILKQTLRLKLGSEDFEFHRSFNEIRKEVLWRILARHEAMNAVSDPDWLRQELAKLRAGRVDEILLPLLVFGISSFLGLGMVWILPFWLIPVWLGGVMVSAIKVLGLAMRGERYVYLEEMTAVPSPIHFKVWAEGIIGTLTREAASRAEVRAEHKSRVENLTLKGRKANENDVAADGVRNSDRSGKTYRSPQKFQELQGLKQALYDSSSSTFVDGQTNQAPTSRLSEIIPTVNLSFNDPERNKSLRKKPLSVRLNDAMIPLETNFRLSGANSLGIWGLYLGEQGISDLYESQQLILESSKMILAASRAEVRGNFKTLLAKTRSRLEVYLILTPFLATITGLLFGFTLGLLWDASWWVSALLSLGGSIFGYDLGIVLLIVSPPKTLKRWEPYIWEEKQRFISEEVAVMKQIRELLKKQWAPLSGKELTVEAIRQQLRPIQNELVALLDRWVEIRKGLDVLTENISSYIRSGGDESTICDLCSGMTFALRNAIEVNGGRLEIVSAERKIKDGTRRYLLDFEHLFGAVSGRDGQIAIDLTANQFQDFDFGPDSIVIKNLSEYQSELAAFMNRPFSKQELKQRQRKENRIAMRFWGIRRKAILELLDRQISSPRAEARSLRDDVQSKLSSLESEIQGLLPTGIRRERIFQRLDHLSRSIPTQKEGLKLFIEKVERMIREEFPEKDSSLSGVRRRSHQFLEDLVSLEKIPERTRSAEPVVPPAKQNLLGVTHEMEKFIDRHHSEILENAYSDSQFGDAVLRREIAEYFFTRSPLLRSHLYQRWSQEVVSPFFQRWMRQLRRESPQLFNLVSELGARDDGSPYTLEKMKMGLRTVMGRMAALDRRQASGWIGQVLGQALGKESQVAAPEPLFRFISKALTRATQGDRFIKRKVQKGIPALEAILGYTFPAKWHDTLLFSLLNQGKTPKEIVQVNNRLSFFGDALLGEWAAQQIRTTPEANTNDLAILVNRDTLTQILDKTKLRDFFYPHFEYPRSTHSVADSFEALLAAVYLAGGWKEMDRVAKRLFAKGILDRNQFDLPEILKQLRPSRAEVRSKRQLQQALNHLNRAETALQKFLDYRKLVGSLRKKKDAIEAKAVSLKPSEKRRIAFFLEAILNIHLVSTAIIVHQKSFEKSKRELIEIFQSGKVFQADPLDTPREQLRQIFEEVQRQKKDWEEFKKHTRQESAEINQLTQSMGQLFNSLNGALKSLQGIRSRRAASGPTGRKARGEVRGVPEAAEAMAQLLSKNPERGVVLPPHYVSDIDYLYRRIIYSYSDLFLSSSEEEFEKELSEIKTAMERDSYRGYTENYRRLVFIRVLRSLRLAWRHISGLPHEGFIATIDLAVEKLKEWLPPFSWYAEGRNSKQLKNLTGGSTLLIDPELIEPDSHAYHRALRIWLNDEEQAFDRESVQPQEFETLRIQLEELLLPHLSESVRRWARIGFWTVFAPLTLVAVHHLLKVNPFLQPLKFIEKLIVGGLLAWTAGYFIQSLISGIAEGRRTSDARKQKAVRLLKEFVQNHSPSSRAEVRAQEKVKLEYLIGDELSDYFKLLNQGKNPRVITMKQNPDWVKALENALKKIPAQERVIVSVQDQYIKFGAPQEKYRLLSGTARGLRAWMANKKPLDLWVEFEVNPQSKEVELSKFSTEEKFKKELTLNLKTILGLYFGGMDIVNQADLNPKRQKEYEALAEIIEYYFSGKKHEIKEFVDLPIFRGTIPLEAKPTLGIKPKIPLVFELKEIDRLPDFILPDKRRVLIEPFISAARAHVYRPGSRVAQEIVDVTKNRTEALARSLQMKIVKGKLYLQSSIEDVQMELPEFYRSLLDFLSALRSEADETVLKEVLKKLGGEAFVMEKNKREVFLRIDRDIRMHLEMKNIPASQQTGALQSFFHNAWTLLAMGYQPMPSLIQPALESEKAAKTSEIERPHGLMGGAVRPFTNAKELSGALHTNAADLARVKLTPGLVAARDYVFLVILEIQTKKYGHIRVVSPDWNLERLKFRYALSMGNMDVQAGFKMIPIFEHKRRPIALPENEIVFNNLNNRVVYLALYPEGQFRSGQMDLDFYGRAFEYVRGLSSPRAEVRSLISADEFEKRLINFFGMYAGYRNKVELNGHQYPYTFSNRVYSLGTFTPYFRAGDIFVLNSELLFVARAQKNESEFEALLQSYPSYILLEEEDIREGWRGYTHQDLFISDWKSSSPGPYYPLPWTAGVLIGMQEIRKQIQGNPFVDVGSRNGLFAIAAVKILGASEAYAIEKKIPEVSVWDRKREKYPKLSKKENLIHMNGVINQVSEKIKILPIPVQEVARQKLNKGVLVYNLPDYGLGDNLKKKKSKSLLAQVISKFPSFEWIIASGGMEDDENSLIQEAKKQSLQNYGKVPILNLSKGDWMEDVPDRWVPHSTFIFHRTSKSETLMVAADVSPRTPRAEVRVDRQALDPQKVKNDYLPLLSDVRFQEVLELLEAEGYGFTAEQFKIKNLKSLTAAVYSDPDYFANIPILLYAAARVKLRSLGKDWNIRKPNPADFSSPGEYLKQYELRIIDPVKVALGLPTGATMRERALNALISEINQILVSFDASFKFAHRILFQLGEMDTELQRNLEPAVYDEVKDIFQGRGFMFQYEEPMAGQKRDGKTVFNHTFRVDHTLPTLSQAQLLDLIERTIMVHEQGKSPKGSVQWENLRAKYTEGFSRAEARSRKDFGYLPYLQHEGWARLMSYGHLMQPHKSETLLRHFKRELDEFALSRGDKTLLSYLERIKDLSREEIQKETQALEKHFSSLFSPEQSSGFFRYHLQMPWFYSHLRELLRSGAPRVKIDYIGPALFQDPFTWLVMIRTAYEKEGKTLEKVPLEFNVFDKNSAVLDLFQNKKLTYSSSKINNDIQIFEEVFEKLPSNEERRLFAQDWNNTKRQFLTIFRSAGGYGADEIKFDDPQWHPWLSRFNLRGTYERLPEDHSVDFVFMNNVYQHVVDPLQSRSMINLIAARVRPAGAILAEALPESAVPLEQFPDTEPNQAIFRAEVRASGSPDFKGFLAKAREIRERGAAIYFNHLALVYGISEPVSKRQAVEILAQLGFQLVANSEFGPVYRFSKKEFAIAPMTRVDIKRVLEMPVHENQNPLNEALLRSYLEDKSTEIFPFMFLEGNKVVGRLIYRLAGRRLLVLHAAVHFGYPNRGIEKIMTDHLRNNANADQAVIYIRESDKAGITLLTEGKPFKRSFVIKNFFRSPAENAWAAFYENSQKPEIVSSPLQLKLDSLWFNLRIPQENILGIGLEVLDLVRKDPQAMDRMEEIVFSEKEAYFQPMGPYTGLIIGANEVLMGNRSIEDLLWRAQILSRRIQGNEIASLLVMGALRRKMKDIPSQRLLEANIIAGNAYALVRSAMGRNSRPENVLKLAKYFLYEIHWAQLEGQTAVDTDKILESFKPVRAEVRTQVGTSILSIKPTQRQILDHLIYGVMQRISGNWNRADKIRRRLIERGGDTTTFETLIKAIDKNQYEDVFEKDRYLKSSVKEELEKYIIPRARQRARAEVRSKFLEGKIFDREFIEKERKLASEKTTVVFDLDHTLAAYDDEVKEYTLRPGIETELKKLSQKGLRLIIWTRAIRQIVEKFLSKYSKVASLFDVVITRENTTLDTEADGDEMLRIYGGYNKNQAIDRYHLNEEMDKALDFYNKYLNTKDISLLGYALIVDDDRDIEFQAAESPSGPFKAYRISPFVSAKDYTEHEELNKLADKVLKLLSWSTSEEPNRHAEIPRVGKEEVLKELGLLVSGIWKAGSPFRVEESQQRLQSWAQNPSERPILEALLEELKNPSIPFKLIVPGTIFRDGVTESLREILTSSSIRAEVRAAIDPHVATQVREDPSVFLVPTLLYDAQWLINDLNTGFLREDLQTIKERFSQSKIRRENYKAKRRPGGYFNPGKWDSPKWRHETAELTPLAIRWFAKEFPGRYQDTRNQTFLAFFNEEQEKVLPMVQDLFVGRGKVFLPFHDSQVSDKESTAARIFTSLAHERFQAAFDAHPRRDFLKQTMERIIRKLKLNLRFRLFHEHLTRHYEGGSWVGEDEVATQLYYSSVNYFSSFRPLGYSFVMQQFRTFLKTLLREDREAVELFNILDQLQQEVESEALKDLQTIVDKGWHEELNFKAEEIQNLFVGLDQTPEWLPSFEKGFWLSLLDYLWNLRGQPLGQGHLADIVADMFRLRYFGSDRVEAEKIRSSSDTNESFSQKIKNLKAIGLLLEEPLETGSRYFLPNWMDDLDKFLLVMEEIKELRRRSMSWSQKSHAREKVLALRLGDDRRFVFARLAEFGSLQRYLNKYGLTVFEELALANLIENKGEGILTDPFRKDRSGNDRTYPITQLDRQILATHLHNRGLPIPAGLRAEVRMQMNVSAIEIPFMAVIPEGSVGLAARMGIFESPIHDVPARRRELVTLIREGMWGGRSEDEIAKQMQALKDVSRDGVGIQKADTSEQPIILQVDLGAVDPKQEAARAEVREGLRLRLRALAPGSAVVVYSNDKEKDAVDPFGRLMQEFPRLRYERKVYSDKIDLREVKKTRERWAKELVISPEHSGFLFSNPDLLDFKEEITELGIVFQFDPVNLPAVLRPLQGNLEAAVVGELAEHAKLTKEARQKVMTENKSLFQFQGGVYSLNLDLWLELRTGELISASA